MNCSGIIIVKHSSIEKIKEPDMSDRKKIERHPAVREVLPTFASDIYRHEIWLNLGYRFGRYDTHSKNVETLRDGVEVLSLIERCPADCHCGEGEQA